MTTADIENQEEVKFLMKIRSIEGRMSLPRRQVRVVLYSHDSLGLGHVRRNLLIAGALSQSNPNVETLLISGTSYASAYEIPKGIDILSLPSLSKVENGHYEPKRLRIGSHDLTEFRATTISAAIRSFRPDLFVVDKVPRGVCGELEPILRFLRDRTNTKVVLGLRDILDDPNRVRSEWAKNNNLKAIEDFYDAVWIYGDPTVYDAVEEYRWGAEMANKTFHTGYLDRTRASKAPHSDVAELLDTLELVDGFNLCVVGGGADGLRLAESVVRADPGNAATLILTGPFMPAAQLSRLKDLSSGRSNVSLARFSSDPVELYRRAGRVVSMGGYNTLLELVGLGKKPLVVPRVEPRTEQLIRATRFEALGLVDMLHPDDLRPSAVSAWFNTGNGTIGKQTPSVDLGGLGKIADSVRELSSDSTGPNHHEVSHAIA